MIGQQVDLLASRRPVAEEMDAYERVLRDAMVGDHTLFAREDYVEEAWPLRPWPDGSPFVDPVAALRPAAVGRQRSVSEA